MKKRVVLGLDTSNYTTSVAAVDDRGSIVYDKRKLLDVPKGKRGLRQQEALFDHINTIPSLMKGLEDSELEICGVSCSVSPRPVEGSYMPVFLAGTSIGRSIASALNVPFFEFSHQEGHIASASYGTDLPDRAICYHLSGGTLEAVLLPDFDIVYKTLDISYGKLIDRVGVALGFDFPCGREMDAISECTEPSDDHFKLPAAVLKEDGINLSGVESQAMKYISGSITECDKSRIIRSLFDVITKSIADMTKILRQKYDVNYFLLAGGVSSSKTLRHSLKDNIPSDIEISFGRTDLSSDNAVGIAILGARKLWQ